MTAVCLAAAFANSKLRGLNSFNSIHALSCCCSGVISKDRGLTSHSRQHLCAEHVAMKDSQSRPAFTYHH